MKLSSNMPDQQDPGPKENNSLGELGGRISRARHEAGLEKTAEEQDADAAAGSALGVAWRISIEIVVALVVCTAIGWALDYWFGTKPWLMLIFLFLGGIIRRRTATPSALAGGLRTTSLAAARLFRNASTAVTSPRFSRR